MTLPTDPQQTEQQRLSKNLRRTLQMQREGILAMRQELARQHPSETPDQINRRLSDWLAETPDANDPRFVIRRDYRSEQR